jgi:hypothetical protein
MPLALINSWIILAYLIIVLLGGYLFEKLQGKIRKSTFSPEEMYPGGWLEHQL